MVKIKLPCYVCNIPNASSIGGSGEHILPKWMFGYQKIDRETISLAGASVKKDNLKFKLDNPNNFTVGCCVQCNTLMNNELERPMQDLFKQNFENLNDSDRELISLWCFNILSKTCTFNPEMKKAYPQKVKIYGEEYLWGKKVSFPILKAKLNRTDKKWQGSPVSLFLFKMKPTGTNSVNDEFDFIDYANNSKTFFLRMKNMGIIAVGDSGFSQNMMDYCAESFEKSNFFPNRVQARELGGIFAEWSTQVNGSFVEDNTKRVFIFEKSSAPAPPFYHIDASMPLLFLMHFIPNPPFLIADRESYFQSYVTDKEPVLHNLCLNSLGLEKELTNLGAKVSKNSITRGSELLFDENFIKNVEPYGLYFTKKLSWTKKEIKSDTPELIYNFLNRNWDFIRRAFFNELGKNSMKEKFLLVKEMGIVPKPFTNKTLKLECLFESMVRVENTNPTRKNEAYDFCRYNFVI